MKYKYVIIDPASTEFNRGSFCYLPYIIFNYLDSEHPGKVKIIENFTVTDIDKLPETELYLVALWSYPQIDACLVLNKFLHAPITFFGYIPLIQKYGFHLFKVTEEVIKTGMMLYPRNYKKFDYLLLSDCDMHLSKYEGQVVPLFTSYGCPRNCAFCPSTVNTGHHRHALNIYTVDTMLLECAKQGFKNIHFTDEDFFFDIDRTHRILSHIKGLNENIMGCSLQYRDHENFNLISLGEVKSVLKYVNKYGNETLLKSGMKLIEVGIETADEDLGSKMGKHPVALCKELSEKCQVDIFWLTMTFFPGETITTLNKTGQFLRRHGFNYEEVKGRIRTNGTEGGLGQFFQPYYGTKDYNTLWKKGVILTHRPVRLLPSFLPKSFTDCTIIVERDRIEEDEKKWFDLYKLDPFFYQKGCLKQMHGKTVLEEVFSFESRRMKTDAMIFIAICARLGIIKEG